jgi:hypothetical protein
VEVTILYYTSNRENPEFEKKIIENLVKNSNGLPIVSVSQKPMNLGINICMGELPHSYESEFKQIKAGLEWITTPYVLTAESDFLYPPEYFELKPMELGHCYRYWGVWIGYDNFRFKGYSDGAQLVDRHMWLDLINRRLEKGEHCQPARTHAYDYHLWKGNPAITFKTGKNVCRFTAIKKQVKPETTLPYWGDINELKTKLNYEQHT